MNDFEKGFNKVSLFILNSLSLLRYDTICLLERSFILWRTQSRFFFCFPWLVGSQWYFSNRALIQEPLSLGDPSKIGNWELWPILFSLIQSRLVSVSDLFPFFFFFFNSMRSTFFFSRYGSKLIFLFVCYSTTKVSNQLMNKKKKRKIYLKDPGPSDSWRSFNTQSHLLPQLFLFDW
jgi:hypothetical protein